LRSLADVYDERLRQTLGEGLRAAA
jgi:hypothetical protein